jgi:hypothetical protein
MLRAERRSVVSAPALRFGSSANSSSLITNAEHQLGHQLLGRSGASPNPAFTLGGAGAHAACVPDREKHETSARTGEVLDNGEGTSAPG